MDAEGTGFAAPAQISMTARMGRTADPGRENPFLGFGGLFGLRHCVAPPSKQLLDNNQVGFDTN